MKRNIARRTLVILSIATLYMSMAAMAQAEGPACSLALTAGKYALTDTGTVVGIGPRTAVGIWTMDAAGNVLNGKGTSSLNGNIAVEKFSGTYTVNGDCTGTIAVDIFDQSGNKILTVTGNLAWDDNVQEVRFIFTSAVLPNGTPLATVINGDARKLFPQSSNEQ
jgi:uncharacterized protein YdeI (BOF family)